MKTKIISWIKRHKAISILIGVGLLLGSLFWRMVVIQTRDFIVSEPLKKGTICEAVYGIGTVTANQSFQLKSGVTTTIRKLYVKEGDLVKKGDRLVDLEGTTLFTAPFSGTITYVPFKEGETVFAQSVVLDLLNLKDRYILVSLEQRGALRIKAKQKAKINFDTIREQTYEGEVQAIYSHSNDFLVSIVVSNLPPQILPGMTADVSIVIREKANVLLIPVAAMDLDGVMVQHGGSGMPEREQIKTGLVDGAMAEVVSGNLKDGDKLIIRKKKAK
jgi:membrane fusion protein, macrolide-specific efflux system